MSKNELIKGVFLVGLGATSYGMLATIVKLAYQDTEKFTTAEVITAQFVYGILGMLLINLYQKTATKTPIVKATSKNIINLMLAGTSLGATSIFYYLCVKYIDVSIAIVLLMQTVWMGVIIEWILDKKAPSKQKVIAVLVVLLGTILATNLLFSKVGFNWTGFMWGMLAATSFTTTMYTANKVGLGLSSAQRSLYMLLGGAIIVIFFGIYTQTDTFNLTIFGKYGILLALFGTIIPPILMNSGFPKTGLGLGSIVSSLELPVSVSMAYFLLHEKVVFSQWIGIILIIGAIVIMNINLKKK
ncbi:EamA family transporter [Flavobacterium jejuense]|uniref:EamA family transporter n=1 Tax=Flavobacterium jejuense TaxID=1544455 RepID=A0ABX0IRT6_9FLAO|nr:DMT family transporter [Flavobacterium jejuense]NHN26238.1 EamA family transporter [Flavobacterium jejuense]